MGLGDFFRTILKVGAAVPGPWQVPAAIGSAGVGMLDRSGATGYGANGQKLPSPYAPGGQWDPKQFDHPQGWEGAGNGSALGGGIPGAPQGPAGAFGYAGVPSLAQLDSEWRGMRSGAGAFGTPNGVIGPPIPMGKDLGGRGGLGAMGGILSALGPLGLQMLLKQLSKGKKLPKGFKWPGGSANNPNSPDETADDGSGSDYYDPYMDDNSGGSVADFDPSGGGGTSDFYTPDISAASGLPPTYLPSGANITAHPGEVAQVIPADQVASASPDPLSLPPGEPGPSGTPAPVQPADLAFERNQQGGGQDSGPTPPPIAPEHGQGISKALLSYLPLILGGGGMLAMAARASKKNPPPPGQNSQLHSAFQGLVEGYAGGKLNNALANRRSQMEQQEFLVKEAHRAVMDARGVNWDNAAIPPATKQRFQELNQKYTQALSKDSPGGSLITTGEAAEIVAIKASLDQALGQSGQARDIAGREAIANIPYGGDNPERLRHESAMRAGQEKQAITKELAARLGMPELEGTYMDSRSLSMLMRQPPGSFKGGVVLRDGISHRIYRNIQTGEEVDLGVAPMRNEHYTYESPDTGEKTRITAPPSFVGAAQSRTAPASPKPSAIAPPPVARPEGIAPAPSAASPTAPPSGAPMGGKPHKLSSMGESAVLAVDNGLPLMRELMSDIEKAGLQDDNSLASMAGSRANAFVYQQGAHPGEYQEKMQQLGGFIRANMLSNFPTRFRNQTMQHEITRHLIDPTRDSPKLMYSKLKKLVEIAQKTKKNIYKVERVPYQEGEAEAETDTLSAPPGDRPTSKKKVYNPATGDFQ